MAAVYGVGVLVKVAFYNPKKFPSAEAFLSERRRRELKSPEEQRAFFSQIAVKVG